MDAKKTVRRLTTTLGLAGLLGTNTLSAQTLREPARHNTQFIQVLSSQCGEWINDTTKATSLGPAYDSHPCVNGDPSVAPVRTPASVENDVYSPAALIPATEYRTEELASQSILISDANEPIKRYVTPQFLREEVALAQQTQVTKKEEIACIVGLRTADAVFYLATDTMALPIRQSRKSAVHVRLGTNATYAPCPESLGYIGDSHTHRVVTRESVQTDSAEITGVPRDIAHNPTGLDDQFYKRWDELEGIAQEHVVVAENQLDIVNGIGRQRNATVYRRHDALSIVNGTLYVANGFTRISDERRALTLALSFRDLFDRDESSTHSTASGTPVLTDVRPQNNRAVVEQAMWASLLEHARTNWTGDHTRVAYPRYNEYYVVR